MEKAKENKNLRGILDQKRLEKSCKEKKNIKIAFHCFYVKKIPIRSMLIISWFKILNLMMDIDPNISM